MKKKINLNMTLTRGECGCGHGAEQRADTHSAGAEHACCDDGNRVVDLAHRHKEDCCGGAHTRPATTADRDAIPDKAEGTAR